MSGCRFQATLAYMETVDRDISVIWVYHCWFIFCRLAGILSLCLFPWPTYWRSITRMRNMWVLWTVVWHCVSVCTIKHSSVDTTISFYCVWVAVHKCAICGTCLSHCIHPKKATGELIACAWDTYFKLFFSYRLWNSLASTLSTCVKRLLRSVPTTSYNLSLWVHVVSNVHLLIAWSWIGIDVSKILYIVPGYSNRWLHCPAVPAPPL